MKETTKNKIRSTVFWAGLASAVLLAVQLVAGLFGVEVTSEKVTATMTSINGILSALTVAGVLVSPSKVESFQTFKVQSIQSFKKKEK
jgi:uncharacterized membrane protein